MIRFKKKARHAGVKVHLETTRGVNELCGILRRYLHVCQWHPVRDCQKITVELARHLSVDMGVFVTHACLQVLYSLRSVRMCACVRATVSGIPFEIVKK